MNLVSSQVDRLIGERFFNIWYLMRIPFREALNAAVHNDVSLLELLAPEVQEPARQFLAVIAPKLLQQSVA